MGYEVRRQTARSRLGGLIGTLKVRAGPCGVDIPAPGALERGQEATIRLLIALVCTRLAVWSTVSLGTRGSGWLLVTGARGGVGTG